MVFTREPPSPLPASPILHCPGLKVTTIASFTKISMNCFSTSFSSPTSLVHCEEISLKVHGVPSPLPATLCHGRGSTLSTPPQLLSLCRLLHPTGKEGLPAKGDEEGRGLQQSRGRFSNTVWNLLWVQNWPCRSCQDTGNLFLLWALLGPQSQIPTHASSAVRQEGTPSKGPQALRVQSQPWCGTGALSPGSSPPDILKEMKPVNPNLEKSIAAGASLWTGLEQHQILEVLESRLWFTALPYLLLQTAIRTSRLQPGSKTDAVKYSGKVFAQV